MYSLNVTELKLKLTFIDIFWRLFNWLCLKHLRSKDGFNHFKVNESSLLLTQVKVLEPALVHHSLHGLEGVEDDVEDEDHQTRAGVTVLSHQFEGHTVLHLLTAVAVTVHQIICELLRCCQGWRWGKYSVINGVGLLIKAIFFISFSIRNNLSDCSMLNRFQATLKFSRGYITSKEQALHVFVTKTHFFWITLKLNMNFLLKLTFSHHNAVRYFRGLIFWCYGPGIDGLHGTRGDRRDSCQGYF